ncbi:hypothetical protein K2V52_09355 [Staphylococcus nepalensis]|uniref:hypothetical protein n=1 Tax=Staphylococcus nepalensis TaxID=214473 RepID=UPI001E457DA7|nr:hypothetical protein [Staphylococcus nepalensis]MCD8892179.1 hypothetical protein [Staphylococcus nepalensis]
MKRAFIFLKLNIVPIWMPYDTPVGLDHEYNIGGKTVQFFINDGYVSKVQINS